MLNRAVLFVLAALLAIGLAGCGGHGLASPALGQLTIRMTDSPDPKFLAANVTISKIEVHRQGEWVTVTETPQSIDLLDIALNGTIIGDATVRAGNFDDIRIFISEATVTDAAGVHEVRLNAVTGGIKANLEFTVGRGQTTEVLIDFNSHRGIVKETGNHFMLRSVVKAINAADSGTVVGTVFNGIELVTGAMVSAVYESGGNATSGTIVNSAMSRADGSFLIWALHEGTYTIEVTWTDLFDNEMSAAINGVVVTAQYETSIGNVDLN